MSAMLICTCKMYDCLREDFSYCFCFSSYFFFRLVLCAGSISVAFDASNAHSSALIQNSHTSTWRQPEIPWEKWTHLCHFHSEWNNLSSSLVVVASEQASNSIQSNSTPSSPNSPPTNKIYQNQRVGMLWWRRRHQQQRQRFFNVTC